MKEEHINYFFDSVVSVFGTMLGCELTRQVAFIKDGSKTSCELSGVIGLSGKAKGTIVLSLDKEVALSVTEALMMERPDEINDDVTDAIGELTNMIAGSAKANLQEFELCVGLPSVITGKGHHVKFPSESPPVCMPFDCKWGSLVVEVGLVDAPPKTPNRQTPMACKWPKELRTSNVEVKGGKWEGCRVMNVEG